MPISITDRGQNNKIAIEPHLLASGSGAIVFEGDNNTVSIKSPVYGVGVHLHLVGGAAVHIAENLSAHHLFVYAASETYVHIGRTVGFNGVVRLLLHEPGSITIGDGCLFADNIDITISDMHSVIDIESYERLNPPRSVLIGDRVWIGQRCIILKGVEIGSGAIIGAGAIVTKDVPPNCAAAGNPARVIRRNVSWDFKLL